MSQYGADVEALDNLSRKFEEESGKIQQATSTISSQLQSVWWKGPDAERFKSDWESTHKTALTRIGESLTQAANHCRKQAAEQRQVSGA